ncbi:MAG: hypothetical protein ACM31L_01900 [Actinomycetota bacterium]
MSIQALGGLASALTAQASVANRAAVNIVNVNTPDFAAQQGQLVAQQPAGVADVATPPAGEVDLAREVTTLMMSKSAYGAAAKTFATVARMDQAVLDILA